MNAVSRFSASVLSVLLVLLIGSTRAAEYPPPTEADYVIRDFKFTSGETLPELKVHYRTIGQPVKDDKGIVQNAVLITHGTTGSGAQFIRPEFAGELFGAGQLLDATKFFLVMPDGIGHGKSSKPSDGMHARFPRYGYVDMVEAQFRLLTAGLGVNHARLVMGTSMGGMHTWLWGSAHPEFMDALMPLASLPAQISGRNRAWRRVIIDAIRNDPDWKGGEYSAQPPSLRTAAEMLWLMSSNPILRQKDAPDLKKSDEAVDKFVADHLKADDANDVTPCQVLESQLWPVGSVPSGPWNHRVRSCWGLRVAAWPSTRAMSTGTFGNRASSVSSASDMRYSRVPSTSSLPSSSSNLIWPSRICRRSV